MEYVSSVGVVAHRVHSKSRSDESSGFEVALEDNHGKGH
jgi:hypothetical protein